MIRPSGKQLDDIKLFCRGYVACLENQVDIMNGSPIEAYQDFENWVEWNEELKIKIIFNDTEKIFDCFVYAQNEQGIIKDDFIKI